MPIPALLIVGLFSAFLLVDIALRLVERHERRTRRAAFVIQSDLLVGQQRTSDEIAASVARLTRATDRRPRR